MDRKRLTPKEMFRTLAFHYHYDQKIPLDMLCDMVSTIYYPNDPTGETKKRYKNLLITLMKEYTNGEKTITQTQFCDYMNEMAKLKKEEYSLKLTNRIFDRYAEVDPDSKERVIGHEGFKKIAASMKIKPDDSFQYFKTVADRKNQITFDKFNDYMNAVMIKEVKESEKK